jgi:nitroimidazol reductase NimA-like FMN-containing flavoprotein (pyridoxamine 5'-phosphate oxidase superfamily)
MAVSEDATWVEHLTASQCRALLASVPVGRVGVLHDSAPEIYPVNHAVDAGTVVFRTDPGTKLAALLRSPAVCFEVDGIDPGAATGWSVLVKGRATEVDDPAERARLEALPLRFWGVGEKAHWVRIVADEVSGRRIWR